VHTESGCVNLVVVLDQAYLAGSGIGRHRVLLVPYSRRLALCALEDKSGTGKQESVSFG
jgi:hypothetical protein